MDARELIDWHELGRVLGIAGGVWLALMALGIAATAAIISSTPDMSIVGVWFGLAAVGFLVTAIGVAAYSALGAMRRAGDRGERLAGGDVGLLPRRQLEDEERT